MHLHPEGVYCTLVLVWPAHLLYNSRRINHFPHRHGTSGPPATVGMGKQDLTAGDVIIYVSHGKATNPEPSTDAIGAAATGSFVVENSGCDCIRRGGDCASWVNTMNSIVGGPGVHFERRHSEALRQLPDKYFKLICRIIVQIITGMQSTICGDRLRSAVRLRQPALSHRNRLAAEPAAENGPSVTRNSNLSTRHDVRRDSQREERSMSIRLSRPPGSAPLIIAFGTKVSIDTNVQ